MRGLVGIISAVAGLALAGQACAAPLALNDIAGHWREPTGSCDAPYLQATERMATADGRGLKATIRSGGAEIAGDLMLSGRRAGRLVWDKTGKPAFQMLLYKGELKVSPTDKATGLKSVKLTPCEGSRPDYAAGDATRTAIAGAWYEVTKTGLKTFKKEAGGVEGCATADAQRGDLVFVEDNGALRWSLRAPAGHGEWRQSAALPEAFLGKTWLKTTLGPEGQTRFVSLMPIEREQGQRLVLADPQTKSFRYYNACPAS